MNHEEEISRLKREFDRQCAAWDELRARFAALSGGSGADWRMPAAWLDDLRDAVSAHRSATGLPEVALRGVRA